LEKERCQEEKKGPFPGQTKGKRRPPVFGSLLDYDRGQVGDKKKRKGLFLIGFDSMGVKDPLWIIFLQFQLIDRMSLDMKDKKTISLVPLMIVYLVGAGLFIGVLVVAPQLPFRFVIKAVPALSLFWATLLIPGIVVSQRMALLVGALFCAVGDVLLDIDRVRLFVPGLAAFLLGHIGFLSFFGMRRVSASPRRIWTIPVLFFALIMAIILIPRLGSLLLPVLAYLVVITLMTILAIVSDIRSTAALGAGLFMVSDALLALAKFVFPGQPSPLFSIPVYFSGLFLLGFGILGSIPKRRDSGEGPSQGTRT
jgi:uncharacterized membrane protein YhhN